jgi:ferrous iron transport protein A
MLTCTSDPSLSQQSSHSSIIFLDALPKSKPAEVVGLPPGQGATHRLAELGIFIGAVLRLERSAPLGGPVLVNVQGTRVALGRHLAHRIQVRVLP